jgi:hypothetical protein
MKVALSLLLLGLVASVGCKARNGASVLRDNGSPRASRYLRSAEEILAYAEGNWQLRIEPAERDEQFLNMSRFLGGVVQTRGTADIMVPNPFYVVAVDNMSWFLSERILQRQALCESSGDKIVKRCGQRDGDATRGYDACPFHGKNDCFSNGPDPSPAPGCFAGDPSAWCNFDDGIRLTSIKDSAFFRELAKKDVGKGTPWSSLLPSAPPPELKKRLWHNIQDLGEYLATPLDDLNLVPAGGSEHSADYLLMAVFWPTFRETGSEEAAWRQTIYSILVSGGFFMKIDDVVVDKDNRP